jgi:diaminohydroxyphosphoribosylaminopyrimidine deaminase/5-amino-6-(5-phosphoribosylamino)uracil reductase
LIVGCFYLVGNQLDWQADIGAAANCGHVAVARGVERAAHARIKSPSTQVLRAAVKNPPPAGVASRLNLNSFTWSEPAVSRADCWNGVPSAFRARVPLPAPWDRLFGPLQAGAVDDLVVIGQIGQSLDGRIASVDGRREFINGQDGLAHLHRLRALVDAVVVGIGTALADDPQLTVRRVDGPNPARVVIDPRGRLPRSARLLGDDGARRVVITNNRAHSDLPAGVERIVLATGGGGHIDPADIIAALARTGCRRLLIEGGAETLSRFLAAQCLDRIHIVVAPIILGSGRASCMLSTIAHADDAIRPQVRAVPLGDEVLFDCDLSRHRRVLGVPGQANRST